MGVLYDYDEDVVLNRQAENPGDPTKITVNCSDKTGLGCDLCRIILQFGLSISGENVLTDGKWCYIVFWVANPSYCCRVKHALEPSSSSSSSSSSIKIPRFFRRGSDIRQLSSSLSLRVQKPIGTLNRVVKAVATPDSAVELPLTAENVESVLGEVRPYLISDGGNVALHEIDGNVVRLKLQGACGSCPSSVMTMKMGIERRLMEKIPEIVAVEPVPDGETGLELNERETVR